MKPVARKRFGQNFLKEPYIIEKIVASINPQKEEELLEIGPGLGALTFPVLNRCHKLTAVELDRDLITNLTKKAKSIGELNLIECDILKVQLAEIFPIPEKIRVFGNLPYNISTPIIFHLLTQRQLISDMHFMLQKEMVERMVALPNSKSYGRLSVMVQYYCQAQLLFLVGPENFEPMPKVDSAIIKLQPHKHLPFQAYDENKFATIVREAFNQRRKTLSNSLKKLLTLESFELAGINPKQRPEQLSVEDFVTLANNAQFSQDVSQS